MFVIRSYEETAHNVYRRIEAYELKKKKKIRTGIRAATVTMCILAVYILIVYNTSAEREEWNYAKNYRIKGGEDIELKEQIDMMDVPEEYLISADTDTELKEQIDMMDVSEEYLISADTDTELKEQIDMMDVPEEYLISADAEELIKNVVNYPLLIDAFVYDNPEQGVEHIRNTCSALDELLKRDDALELINKALEDVSRYIDEDNIQGELAESVAEGFLKLLLQTEF